MKNVALDTHKRYSLGSVEDAEGRILAERRIPHRRGEIRDFLTGLEPGTPVAVETIGSWYWIVDEIEEAGMTPRLVNAGLAKKRMGLTNKSDRLDVRGLNTLQRTGTLPEVWIPPKQLRDLRELTRTRMYLVYCRTGLKNRVHADLAKYCLHLDSSDVFAPGCRDEFLAVLEELPPQTRFAAREQLDWIDHLGEEVAYFEQRIAEVFQGSAEVELIDTLPGVGRLLAVVIWLEVGDVERFASAGKLASYAGTTPRLWQSGARRRYGPTRPDVNRYLPVRQDRPNRNGTGPSASGPMSRRRAPSAATAATGPRGTSSGSTRGCARVAGTGRPWSPSPVTWPRRHGGC